MCTTLGCCWMSWADRLFPISLRSILHGAAPCRADPPIRHPPAFRAGSGANRVVGVFGFVCRYQIRPLTTSLPSGRPCSLLVPATTSYRLSSGIGVVFRLFANHPTQHERPASTTTRTTTTARTTAKLATAMPTQRKQRPHLV